MQPGDKLGHYEIDGPIGKGGMGEVYRARDTKLGRDVAIKVLPTEMSGDPERLARFDREARTLASLQHANIASVYGFEREGNTRFLIMELVEGEDLSERLKKGALRPDEAVEIALQIAHGLEAAHAQGIIHRDLKPANIKLTPEGQVKILDFGLARAYTGDPEGPEGAEGDPGMSPTLTAAMTMPGVILGTAAYMSPEQARGHAVDQRADMWAFGVILFEMLTGPQLFGGDTISDTLAAVLRKDLDFRQLPENLPAGVMRVLRRCLQRKPSQRLRSAGDAALELADPDPGTATAATGTAAPRWALAVIGVLAVALAAVALWPRTAPPTAIDERSLHLDVAMPDGLPLGATAPSLSPDGNWLAFVVVDSLDQDILYLRPLQNFISRVAGEIEIDAESDVGALFWSPDSRRLGIQTGNELVALDVESGISQKIQQNLAMARGASWGSQGSIVYAPGANTGLYVLDGFETEPRAITAIDSTRADASHRWPVFLPDGRRFLFTVWSNAAAEQEEIGGIYLGDVDGSEPRRLLRDPSQARIDPAGHILFHRNGKLLQVPFDTERAEITGEPSFVADDIYWSPNNGMIMADVAATGDLVLGSTYEEGAQTLGWMDLAGNFEEMLEVEGGVIGLALAPGNRYAALDRLTPGSSVEIWIADLQRQTLAILSRSGSDCWRGVFSPDGRDYVYTSQDPGFERLYRQAIDGASPPETLVDLQSVNSIAYSWSPDGFLLFSHRHRNNGIYEIARYDFESGEAAPLLTDFNPTQPQLSPDGRWLAYVSDESGRDEVYVRPFPGLDRKWQVSTGGGAFPHWREDGAQLLYFKSPWALEAVTVGVEEDRLEFSTPFHLASFHRRYDYIVPTPDHERFLCARNLLNPDSEPIRFISNWRGLVEVETP